MMPLMFTPKILLKNWPLILNWKKRVSELIDIVEAEPGHLDRADEAENAVIDNLKG